MASLMDLFYGKTMGIRTKMIRAIPPVVSPSPSAETFKATMWQDLLAFQHWVAGVWQEIPSEAHQGILSKLERIQERIDTAYQQGDWAAFQSALVDARAVVSQALGDNSQIPSGSSHWVCRVWSKVLDGEVWWAHCNDEVDRLLQQGVSRGVVYTESELRELVHLPRPCDQALRDIHLLKLYFDGTVIGEDEDDHHHNR